MQRRKPKEENQRRIPTEKSIRENQRRKPKENTN